MLKKLKRFTASFVWCKKVTDCRLAQGFASLGVFLMELVPARVRVPANICVVISQEPLSCSVCEWAYYWRDALKHHVWQIRQWMKAKHFAITPLSFNLTNDLEKQIETRLAYFDGILAKNGSEVPAADSFRQS